MFFLNWFATETPQVKQEEIKPKYHQLSYDEYCVVMMRIKSAEDKLDAIVNNHSYTPTSTPNPFDVLPKTGESYKLSVVEYTDITNRLKLLEERLEMTGHKNAKSTSTPTPTPSPVPAGNVHRTKAQLLNPFQRELGHKLAIRRIANHMSESHGFSPNEVTNIIEEYERIEKCN